MFTNLIESNLHTSEFKRRGSFFLYTITAYTLLFIVVGVGSIYAYDARLDDQDSLEITMLPPVDLPGPPKAPDNHVASPPRQPTKERAFDVRTEKVADINHPELATPPVSTKPN